MGTILYHGTRIPEGIEAIDLTKSKTGASSAEYGVGFYTSLNRADGEANAGWRGGNAGWCYEFEVKADFDTYSKGHRDRWISGYEDVTRELVHQIATSMQTLGGDIAKAGAEMLEKFDKGHYKDHSGRNFIVNLQTQFGYPREGDGGKHTVGDILHAAGYDGLRGNGGGYFVFMNPHTLPTPVPHSFGDPHNPQADAIGKLLYEVSALKSMDEYSRSKQIEPRLMQDLRETLASAVTDVQKGGVDAYAKILGVRHLLDESGAQLSDFFKHTLDRAEHAAGAVAKLTPEQVDARRGAEALVQEKPERLKGEGFLDYKDRVFAWYDAGHKDDTPEQQRAFSHALFDQLYRDAQRVYAKNTADAMGIDNNPGRLERMLVDHSSWGLSRDMGAIQHVEYETDTLNSKPGYRQPETPSATSFVAPKSVPKPAA